MTLAFQIIRSLHHLSGLTSASHELSKLAVGWRDLDDSVSVHKTALSVLGHKQFGYY